MKRSAKRGRCVLALCDSALGAALTTVGSWRNVVLSRAVRKLMAAIDIVRAFSQGSETVAGLQVHGSPEFRAAVVKALRVLRENRLPAWSTLTQHVGSILEGRRSAVIVTAHPAFMFIDGPHSGQEPELLAATIAHMACSCLIHREYEVRHPGRRVPREVYAGAEALSRCEEAYRECLLRLGHESNGNCCKPLSNDECID